MEKTDQEEVGVGGHLKRIYFILAPKSARIFLYFYGRRILGPAGGAAAVLSPRISFCDEVEWGSASRGFLKNWVFPKIIEEQLRHTDPRTSTNHRENL